MVSPPWYPSTVDVTELRQHLPASQRQWHIKPFLDPPRTEHLLNHELAVAKDQYLSIG
jgi:hypothetical protein